MLLILCEVVSPEKFFFVGANFHFLGGWRCPTPQAVTEILCFRRTDRRTDIKLLCIIDDRGKWVKIVNTFNLFKRIHFVERSHYFQGVISFGRVGGTLHQNSYKLSLRCDELSTYFTITLFLFRPSILYEKGVKLKNNYLLLSEIFLHGK